MRSDYEFRPNWASAPGDTVADILSERNLSVMEFAERMGHTPEQGNDLLEGRATITMAVARRLQRVLGASVEFWMSRDFQYRQDIARIHAADKEWLNELPIGDMVRFGWVKPVPHPSEEVAACLLFFGIRSVEAWRLAYANVEQLAAFRTSPSFDSRPAPIAAWLRQGEIETDEIKCGLWNPERFEASLPAIRALTREKGPRRFVPELRRLCASSGVALAVVRSPNGCRASGATRVLSQYKVLIQLSFRHLSDDHFWFTFFHEAAHALLHREKSLFVDGIGEPATAEEREANEYAGRILIPEELQPALLALPADSRQIIRFARRAGVSPGIVVGQLQHYGRIKPNHFNGLKRRFRWED